MDIKNYSDLSDFVFAEYEKLQDLGVVKPPTAVLKAMDRQCVRYMKLYSKPFYRQQRNKLRLQQAIESMPHGWFWKKLHPKLWSQVEYALKEEQRENKSNASSAKSDDSPPSVYPEFPKAIDVPQLSHIPERALEGVKE